MTIIKEGFEFNGFKYGLKKKVLYRLPSVKNGRSYPLKIIPVIKLSETGRGYRLVRVKKSILQVRSMIEEVNWSYNLKQCKECL